MKTFASFKTDGAPRYLKILCQHFGTKAKTRCDANEGLVQFPFGSCNMMVRADCLDLQAQADDLTALKEVEEIMTRHLERFAFRENPALEWRMQNP